MALVADRRIVLPAGTKGFTIWGLFDVHADSRDCDHNRLNQCIREIKDDPFARVVIGGDFNDMMFAKGDPRFTPEVMRRELVDLPDPADAVVKMNCDLLAPIKDRIDAYLCGNHEANYTERHKTDVAKRTCEQLGLEADPDGPRYMGYNGFLRHAVQREKSSAVRTLQGFLHHGAGTGAPVTKGTITMERLKAMTSGEDYIMTGHIHTNIAVADPTVEPRGEFGKGYVQERAWIGMVCGTLKKSLSVGATATFSEQRMHRVAPLHPAVLKVELRRHTYSENGKQKEEALSFKMSAVVTCG